MGASSTGAGLAAGTRIDYRLTCLFSKIELAISKSSFFSLIGGKVAYCYGWAVVPSWFYDFFYSKPRIWSIDLSTTFILFWRFVQWLSYPCCADGWVSSTLGAEVGPIWLTWPDSGSSSESGIYGPNGSVSFALFSQFRASLGLESFPRPLIIFTSAWFYWASAFGGPESEGIELGFLCTSFLLVITTSWFWVFRAFWLWVRFSY